MSWKQTFSMLTSKFFWKNIGIAFAVAIFIIIVTFVSLKYTTHHGENIEVPDLTGLYQEEANLLLSKKGLVGSIIDSIYIRGKRPGEIIEQNPAPKSFVKNGRRIYLIINAKQKKTVQIPDLTDISYRQAKAMLESLGLVVKEIHYIPSEFEGLVRSIKYKNQTITPGSRIDDGANITLIVGKGSMADTQKVPLLQSLTYEKAVQLIQKRIFTLGATYFDREPDNEIDKNKNYFVYKQKPEPDVWLETGKRIDIWLTDDPGKLNARSEDKPIEEDFF